MKQSRSGLSDTASSSARPAATGGMVSNAFLSSFSMYSLLSSECSPGLAGSASSASMRAVAPQIDHSAELAVATDRVREEQAVEPARRRTRDHVDDRVDVGEPLEDAPDAAAAHEIEVLARDAFM